MATIKPIAVELQAVDPADKILGRDKWDRNRGFQKEAFVEALKRARIAQEDEDTENSKR